LDAVDVQHQAETENNQDRMDPLNLQNFKRDLDETFGENTYQTPQAKSE
jgi:hypothetical protein